MTDQAILAPLVEKILHFSSLPIQNQRKELWASHQALERTSKIPVCVYWEGIPPEQWQTILGDSPNQCSTPTGRELEYYFRRVIWIAENVQDDHIVWPLAKISVPMKKIRDWGVSTDWVGDTHALGAKALAAPLKDGYDFSMLTEPLSILDEEAWAQKQEEANTLLNGKLKLWPFWPSLGFSPFDIAADMRGLETLMLDPLDAPESLHKLLDFITTAMVNHHRFREKMGWINFMADPTERYQPMFAYRFHCARLPEDWRNGPKLAYEWAYLGAQTSSGFGPDMFREFVQPYYARIAELLNRKTVYYHGCEPLDQKADSILELPNLRRFHVSPWSSLPVITKKVNGKAVLEVHSHPAKVFFSWGESEIRAEIRRLIKESEGHPMDLNLSDIHSVNNNPAQMSLWARIAQEEVTS